MKKNKGNFNWFDWAGIKPTELEVLIVEAKKKGVPTFPNDTGETIYNRLLSYDVFQNNKSSLLVNKVLAFISFSSAVVAVLTLFIK